MLHELLLSLLGKPGAIIKQYDKQFKVDASVTFLSAAEASLINQIAQTGFYYSQIIKFIDYELTQSSYNDFKKTPSIYRKAMAQGLRKTIGIYQSLILGIQSDYLKSKYFTFSNIRAETTKFELIMKEICELITRITNQKYRGGNIVDILWEILQKGNQWLKDWIAMMFKQCASVFVRQIAAWIAHGQIIDTEDQFFIHKIVQEPQEKFRFTKNQAKNVELTAWDIYTLDQSLIPLSLISSETAGKILFIGKSVKILRSSGKISAIPSTGILGEMKLLFEQEYCQILLQSMIERIRHSIAQQMIELIIGQQNLLRQLEKINEYYLMLKGDFYHHFLEQAKCVQNIPHKERVQRKINQTCLQNTFIRLNNLQDAKRVSFEIKPLGFSYVGFKNFLNLCPVGNIDLVQGKLVRFSASGGALWHRTKQIVENNFTVTFTISFKKSKTVFKTKKEDERDKFSNMISLVFQNSRDISTSFHQNPSSLNKIPQYLSINIGYRFSQQQRNYESLITITYKNEKKHSKQTLIHHFIPKKVNFLDENPYIVKVHYNEQEVRISINPASSFDLNQNNYTKINSLKFSCYISLEMNRSNVGFLSNINAFDTFAEIQQWQMISKPTDHYGDIWSDLSLNLSMKWPINLILTPDLMQVFSRINKFLFPIRQIQIDLEQISTKIPRRIKEHKEDIILQKAREFREDRSRDFKAKNRQQKNKLDITKALRQAEIFQRKLSSIRWRMNLTINALWSYFEADVIQSAWLKLKSTILGSSDFEDVIKMIGKYVNTIQTMYFFNALKIQKNIHKIIWSCRNYVALSFKINAEIIDNNTYKQLENIQNSFLAGLKQFYQLLRDLSKTSNSSHLFHLTQRIEGCIDQHQRTIL